MSVGAPKIIGARLRNGAGGTVLAFMSMRCEKSSPAKQGHDPHRPTCWSVIISHVSSRKIYTVFSSGTIRGGQQKLGCAKDPTIVPLHGPPTCDISSFTLYLCSNQTDYAACQTSAYRVVKKKERSETVSRRGTSPQRASLQQNDIRTRVRPRHAPPYLSQRIGCGSSST